MKAFIYRPSRHPMQSGHGGDKKEWFIDFQIDTVRLPNNLIGWVSSGDTNHQKRMRFATKDEALRFAKKYDLDYEIIDYHERKIKPRNYMNNFDEPLIDIKPKKSEKQT